MEDPVADGYDAVYEAWPASPTLQEICTTLQEGQVARWASISVRWPEGRAPST